MKESTEWEKSFANHFAKRNEILIHGTTRMNFENIMLRKKKKPATTTTNKNGHRRPHIILFHLHEMCRTVKYVETQKYW